MIATEIIKLLADNKDALTILIASFGGLITLATLFKAVLEYRLQGRQKRAELFDKFRTTLKTEPRIVRINSLLECDAPALKCISSLDRYYYLGYYEQIAIAVNSGLIGQDVAHYMFGYFALSCWKSKNFWVGIKKDSYYWSVFKKFVETMQQLENRNLNKGNGLKAWDKLTGRSSFKY